MLGAEKARLPLAARRPPGRPAAVIMGREIMLPDFQAGALKVWLGSQLLIPTTWCGTKQDHQGLFTELGKVPFKR